MNLEGLGCSEFDQDTLYETVKQPFFLIEKKNNIIKSYNKVKSGLQFFKTETILGPEM